MRLSLILIKNTVAAKQEETTTKAKPQQWLNKM